MGSLCSNTQLHNQLLAPMRSWNYLPDSTPLLPFTTLGFTTFIPFLLYLSVQILNAYYYALQLNIIHKFLSHLYAFNSLSYIRSQLHLLLCTIALFWPCGLPLTTPSNSHSVFLRLPSCIYLCYILRSWPSFKSFNFILYAFSNHIPGLFLNLFLL